MPASPTLATEIYESSDPAPGAPLFLLCKDGSNTWAQEMSGEEARATAPRSLGSRAAVKARGARLTYGRAEPAADATPHQQTARPEREIVNNQATRPSGLVEH